MIIGANFRVLCGRDSQCDGLSLTAAGTLVAATYRLTVSASTEHAGTHELGLYDPALPHLAWKSRGDSSRSGYAGCRVASRHGQVVSIGQVMGLDAVAVCWLLARVDRDYPTSS